MEVPKSPNTAMEAFEESFMYVEFTAALKKLKHRNRKEPGMDDQEWNQKHKNNYWDS